MDITITCLNCSEEIVRVEEKGENSYHIETKQAYHSLIMFEDRRFLRCTICGFSGTSVPDTLRKLLDDKLGGGKS